MSSLPKPRPLATLLADARYTEEVKTALRMSAAEATRLGHRYIGGEHLLIATVASDTPTGALLRDLGATVAQTRSRVEFIVPHEPAALALAGGEIRVGPRLLVLLEDEAEIAASAATDTDAEAQASLPDLFLALLRDRAALPTRVLDECGVDTRALIIRLRLLLGA